MRTPVILFLLLQTACTLHAAELAEIEKKITQTGTKLRVLQMLVLLGYIKEPTWESADSIISRTSGDLGIRSISINDKGSKSIKTITLMGKSPETWKDDHNIPVTDITIATNKEMLTYRFSEKSKRYKLSGGTRP